MDALKIVKLLTTAREALILMIGALEDYLEIPYDQSALTKRRAKVRQ